MYSHVFLGGTFDRLHKGHEAMLMRALETGDRVTVGLTSDLFVQKFKGEQNILPFSQRKQHIVDWITQHSLENRVTVIGIDDPYEPAASMDDLEAIMVTRDNRIRGEEINSRRQAKGLPTLALEEVSIVTAQDTKPVSSSRVRSGEIDISGRLIMPDNLRPELAKPLGEILTGDTVGSSIEKYRSGIIVSVGDVTTKTLLTAGVVPSLMVIDGKVGRKDYQDAINRLKDLSIPVTNVTSGPGYIAKQAVEAIAMWVSDTNQKVAIIVDGEEDLLTIPVIVNAPLGSVVYYGQPEQGMVEVVVTQEKKNEVAEILTHFQSS